MLKHPSYTIGLLVVPLFLLLLGCGTNSSYAPSASSISSSSIGPPPVQAASGFTNATLSGGYAFGVVGTSGIQAQAGNGGSTVFIAEQDTGGTFVATAIKQ